MGSFTFIFSTMMLCIYGSICVVSVIFAFFLDFYNRIDQTLKVNVVNARTITPLEQNINVIDDWLIKNNRVMGMVLAALSLLDLKLSFDIINTLSKPAF